MTAPKRRLKRGIISKDGMIFWQYHPKLKNGEYWVTQEKYILLQEKHHKSNISYRKKYPERHRAHSRAYYASNAEKVKIRDVAYYQLKKDHILARNAGYYKKNRASVRKYQAKYRRERIESDPLWKLRYQTRTLIANAFAKRSYKKNSKVEKILGCTWDVFAKHIESQFIVGMNWGNRRKWHLDHIIPIASAKSEEEIALLNHYTNFQPLWILDNLKKGSQMPALHTGSVSKS